MFNRKLYIFLLLVSFSTGFVPINSKLCNPILENLRNTDIGVQIVKDMTRVLPNADSVGHAVLHANEVFVNYLLTNTYLSLETKKHLILFVINLSQHGDNTGSMILQTYYDVVSCLL